MFAAVARARVDVANGERASAVAAVELGVEAHVDEVTQEDEHQRSTQA
jgi:hypothetical protein